MDSLHLVFPARRPNLLITAGTCLALAVGCGDGGGDTPTTHARPNVVLVTIDTLRADRCSLYGYDRPTTPFLDELATRGTVFENAYANSSWTAPSMASLFTSLPPRSHGVVKGFVWDGKVIGQDYLDTEFDTLAERLAAAGYETFAVSTNAHLTATTGFAQGFDHFTEIWWETADQTNTQALALRDELDAADPFFLWLHYIDPHVPYEANEPWFSDYERLGWEWGPEHQAVPENLRRAAVEMHNQYDSEINYVDDRIRRIFEALALEDDAIIVVTADHGEAFFDHGVLGHGESLFEEEIRIPLLIRVPEQRTSRRIDALTSLVDLYPTILDLAGLDVPTGLAGTSLRPLLDGDEMAARPVATELDRGGTKKETALRLGRWKLYRRESPTESVALYDLEADPGEQTDRAASEAARTRELTAAWGAFTAAWPRVKARRKVAPHGEDEAERERLRALGYLE